MHLLFALFLATVMSQGCCMLDIPDILCNKQQSLQSAGWRQLQPEPKRGALSPVKSLATLFLAFNTAAFWKITGRGHRCRLAFNDGIDRHSMLNRFGRVGRTSMNQIEGPVAEAFDAQSAEKMPPASQDQLELHAVRLRDSGITIIEEAGIDRQLVDAARLEISNALREALDGVEELGIDPIEQFYRFAEIACRNRKRWDFQPKLGPSSAFKRLLDKAVSVASPILEYMHTELPVSSDEGVLSVRGIMRNLASPTPTIAQTGSIISWGGANMGHFHRDASAEHIRTANRQTRYGLFNVFIPLLDIAQDGDGTMFWPGSHTQVRNNGYTRVGEVENDKRAMAELVAPACPAGGIMLFDFRIYHRGLPNLDRERVVAYAVLSTGGARDTINFPPASLWKYVKELRAKEGEEQQAKRDHITKQCPYWREFGGGDGVEEYTGA